MGRNALILIPALLLSACGSSSDDSPPPPPEPTDFTISATASDGGSISPGSVTVQPGASTTFTVTPNDGFEIDQVSGCQGTLDGSQYTTGAINNDCAVTANFTPVQISVSGTVSGLEGELVLMLGSSSQTLSEDGSFEFMVDQYSNVEVTISSSPDSQNCTIENGAQKADSNISNITVTCVNKITVAQAINSVSDPAFKACLSESLTEEYAEDVDVIECPQRGIESLEGIASFPFIAELSVESNALTSLDLSNNTDLVIVDAWSNELNEIDTSEAAFLRALRVHDNNLTGIDLSENGQLESVNLSQNSLSSVPPDFLAENVGLKELSLNNNQLTEIDVSNNINLTFLHVGANVLTGLDVTANTALRTLYLSNNQVETLDLSNNIALVNLSASTNNITAIDVSSNTELDELKMGGNNLNTIDLSSNTALSTLEMPDNDFVTVDVSSNPSLIVLDLSENLLADIDVSNNTSLDTLTLISNNLTDVPLGLTSISNTEATIDLTANNFNSDVQAELATIKATYINLVY